MLDHELKELREGLQLSKVGPSGTHRAGLQSSPLVGEHSPCINSVKRSIALVVFTWRKRTSVVFGKLIHLTLQIESIIRLEYTWTNMMEDRDGHRYQFGVSDCHIFTPYDGQRLSSSIF